MRKLLPDELVTYKDWKDWKPMRKLLPDEIVTYTGKIVRPLKPDPATIDIEDIAHSLANQCRFTGHTKEFYSTAQHSVEVSLICDYPDALWGLLHDATEAYLSDIARPLKTANGAFGSAYRKAELKLLWAIGEKFNIPLSRGGALPESVKWADDVLLRSEMRDLMPKVIRTDKWYVEGDFLDHKIFPEYPGDAKQLFLDRWEELRDGR